MNPHRSEAVLIVDGAPVTLRLTLAALAEIEAQLGATSLVDLAERLARPSASQLLAIVSAMARAAGGQGADRMAHGDLCLREAMAAVTLLFREVLTGEAPGKPPAPPSGSASGAGSA